MRQAEDFGNSTWDSLCLLTDTISFDKLNDFVSENATTKKIYKDSNYEYGSYQIILKQYGPVSLNYIIDNNGASIDFFNRMSDYIRINNLDDN